MRKINAVISSSILVLFAIHGVIGGFQLAGIYPGGVRVLKMLARLMLTLILVHGAIGIRLTIDTLYAMKKAGVSYWKDNRLFWARRISGFAVFFLILFHVILFLGTEADGAYRLRLFAMPQLLLHLLLVAVTALHVIANVRPVLIACGIRSLKEIAAELIAVLCVILVFAGAMFVLYYFRWMAV
ncbi:MAG: pilus assembly protein PilX [Lachnospiraceae bacterium]|nr:pilus assembly protein PilX [Lachnospiraceae bacterium]